LVKPDNSSFSTIHLKRQVAEATHVGTHFQAFSTGNKSGIVPHMSENIVLFTGYARHEEGRD